MTVTWQQIIQSQFGAAIETVERAIEACPDDLWFDDSKYHRFWYMVSHTVWWLDYYISGQPEGFQPPEPFGLEELDPAGVIPEHPYTKDELLTYLEYGHKKARACIEGLTDEAAGQPCAFPTMDLTAGELVLYILRHLQHHGAQLNLILRQEINSAPRWVFKGRD